MAPLNWYKLSQYSTLTPDYFCPDKRAGGYKGQGKYLPSPFPLFSLLIEPCGSKLVVFGSSARADDTDVNKTSARLKRKSNQPKV